MKTPALLAIGLAAAALTGCTASTEDYVDDVNQIQEDVIKASKAVGSDLNASKKEILDQLDTAKAEVDQAVSDLEDIDVPEDAEKGHEELVKGFEDLEKLYADVRKGVESNSSDAFDELRTKGVEIEKDIDQALDQINGELGLK
jgi:F0F1-type ATP synthase membrane subunit b/b'